ncbi:MAG TPA: MFS transporter [Myxococcaceae bacterium]|jgi:PPP family 3-phenylpropionic acid transporter|nr:MFS transporter [Myxococcaceae bacterium]
MVPRGQAVGAPEVRAAGALPLIGFYALYFSTVGIILPFLPAWLRSLGLPGWQIGLLLALNPAFALVAPPIWGYLADRAGRPDRILSVIAGGAVLGFAPLTVASDFARVALALGAYAFFASSITTLVDSLALQRVGLHGGSYARLRLFGSLGFVASSTAFGLAVDAVDRRAVFVALALMVAYFGWSLTVKARAASVPEHHPFSALGLLRRRDLALMLGAACTHWIACAPFHGTFSIHVTALNLPPWVIGLSSGMGVLAEVAVMYAYPRAARRVSPRWVLLAAFLASALRWAGMAAATSPTAIIALSLLHGMTFGAFYVAAVAFVAQRVPDTLRASGQGLMTSVTFGLGGLFGYVFAGTAYDWLGGHRLFAVSAAAELLPALLILLVREPTARRDNRRPGHRAPLTH